MAPLYKTYTLPGNRPFTKEQKEKARRMLTKEELDKVAANLLKKSKQTAS